MTKLTRIEAAQAMGGGARRLVPITVAAGPAKATVRLWLPPQACNA